MWAGALCGVLCAVAANEAQDQPVSANEFLFGQLGAVGSDLAEALNKKGASLALGENSTNLLMKMMQENGFDVTPTVERAVPANNTFDFYKGQNARTDAILHVVILRANYLDTDEKYLRPAIDVKVTLAASKYGSVLFKGDYSCTETAKNDDFAFSTTDRKDLYNNVSRAGDGFRACMKEIVTDVAATLKRPTPPPAQ